jgi:sugar phosphate isomerase/epimerase
MVGAQLYSFRDMPLDDAIQAMRRIGLGYAELSQQHLVPKDPAEQKAWRTQVPLSTFRDIRRKFDRAGVVLYAYTYRFRNDFTDAEIRHGFEMARALGVTRMTTSPDLTVMPRLDRFAQEFGIYVGVHNHASMRPNEVSTPQDFAAALQGRSKYICLNLDIGHFTAAGFDPVSYLAEHHERIVTLHIKDRKRNAGGKQGAVTPFGEGDTDIKGVLTLLKVKRYPIPAMIEYEYKGRDTIAEVTKCFEYIKAALA